MYIKIELEWVEDKPFIAYKLVNCFNYNDIYATIQQTMDYTGYFISFRSSGKWKKLLLPNTPQLDSKTLTMLKQLCEASIEVYYN